MKAEKYQGAALLFLRIVIASIFLYSTYGKWAYLSAGLVQGAMVYLVWFLLVVEPLGAIALLGGFLTRWASAGLAVIMVGAMAMLRFTMDSAFFTQPQGVGLDYNLLILAGCVIIVAFGAGKYSFDGWKHSNIY